MRVDRGVAAALTGVALGVAALAAAQVQPPQDRINTAIARARQVGIPVTLLESKIAEGKAKGVSLDRIAAALERREAALERAQKALDGRPDPVDSLSVGADAIESGVSDTALKAVAENAPRERRNVAIAVLTELVRQGEAPDVALGRVRDALRRGPNALANLPAGAAGRRGGGPPEGQMPGAGRGGPGVGGEPGPPPSVPGPGKPPQAGRPGGPPPGASNPGRGRG